MGIFLCVSLAYALLAGNLLKERSIAPYFVDLADAFLNGKLYVEHPTNSGYDMIPSDGKWYVAQPPLPAVIAMPFVALLGTANTSDVLIAVLCGALSVTLCAATLRFTQQALSPVRWISVLILYAFGSALVSLSVMGTVWYLGQIVADVSLWAMILAVFSRKPLLAGTFAGLVFLSRPTIVPACVLFTLGCWYLDHSSQDKTLPQIWPLALRFIAAMTPSLLLFAAYNTARFHNPFDLGYNAIVESSTALQRREMLGSFHPAFFPENAYIAFLKPLQFAPECVVNIHCGVIQTDLHGAGLLWTSPALVVYGLAARPSSRPEGYRYILYGLCALLALLPGLFYHNSGEAQFGYRFILDALPFAMLLVAAGARRGPTWLLLCLVGLYRADQYLGCEVVDVYAGLYLSILFQGLLYWIVKATHDGFIVSARLFSLRRPARTKDHEALSAAGNAVPLVVSEVEGLRGRRLRFDLQQHAAISKPARPRAAPRRRHLHQHDDQAQRAGDDRRCCKQHGAVVILGGPEPPIMRRNICRPGRT